MSNLFLIAARRKFRFASPVGALTVEQLFDLPLTTTRSNAASLDNVAQRVNAELESAGTRSFVATADNTAATELALKLDLVKEIIVIRQTENANDKARAERRQKKQALLAALDAAENRELGSKSPAEIRAMIAEMDD